VQGVLHPRFTVLLRSLLENKCPKGAVVIDGGAYWGYFSIYAAKFGCRVKAIEPNPILAEYIVSSAALNRISASYAQGRFSAAAQLLVYPMAISDNASAAHRFNLHHGHWGLSTVHSTVPSLSVWC
jgi:tRNA G37 N-methylase Trm5